MQKLLMLAVSVSLQGPFSWSQEVHSVNLTVTDVQGDSGLVKQISKGQPANFEFKNGSGLLTFDRRDGRKETVPLRIAKTSMPSDAECRSTFSLVGKGDASLFIGFYNTSSSEPDCQNKKSGIDMIFLSTWDVDAQGRHTFMGNMMMEQR